MNSPVRKNNKLTLFKKPLKQVAAENIILTTYGGAPTSSADSSRELIVPIANMHARSSLKKPPQKFLDSS